MKPHELSSDIPESTFFSPTSLFLFFALLHCSLWTLLPTFLEPNYRFDILEMFFIGKERVFSTYKHPAVNSILLEFIYQLTGRSQASPYIASQLCIFLTFLCVWLFSHDILPPRQALLSTFVLASYWSFTLRSTNYNHNLPLLAAWAGVTFFAYRALKSDRLRDWTPLGLVVGLGLQTKYSLLLLILAILAFSLLNKTSRRCWRGPGPYVAILVALVFFSPQIAWLIESRFACLRFPSSSHSLEGTLANRIYVVLFLLLGQFTLIWTTLLILSPLTGFRWRPPEIDENPAKESSRRFAAQYLCYAVLGPVLLSALIAFITTMRLQNTQLAQCWLFLGPLLFVTLRTDPSPGKFRRSAGLCVILAVSIAVFYGLYYGLPTTFKKEGTLLYFPGRELAEHVETLWHDHYDRPLPYVAGGWFYGGNVAIYGKDRPSVHGSNNMFDLKPDFPLSTWSTDEDVRKKGGIVLWRIEDDPVGTDIPENLFELYPEAILQPEIVLQYPYEFRRKKSIRVGIALVPPLPESQAGQSVSPSAMP